MSLLDELKQEAEKRKADADQVGKQKADRDETYKTIIEPQMSALFDYLTKLVDHLKVVKPKSELSFELQGYGPVVAAIDHDYELKNVYGQNKYSREIEYSVNATVMTDRCAQVEVQGAMRLKSIQSAFERVRLVGMQNLIKNDNGEAIGGTYRARGKIRMGAQISGDADTGALKISFNNIDGFGNITKTIQAQAIDEKLFDAIGRYLLRSSFDLMREQLPDDVRNQIKNKVAQDQLRRTWENKILDLQTEELPKLRRDFSFFARLSQTITDWRARKLRERGNTPPKKV